MYATLPAKTPPPTERDVEDSVWSFVARTVTAPPAVSGVLEATVAVVGASPRSVDETALPAEMTPPPAVSADDEVPNADTAASSMSVPALSDAAASVAATLGEPKSFAFGNANSATPPLPPPADAPDRPSPGGRRDGAQRLARRREQPLRAAARRT